jgi:uncharacterized membrane protein YjfL (UPF0719 family)
MERKLSETSRAEVVDIKLLCSDIWAGKWVVILGLALGLLFSLLYYFITPKKFEAELILVQKENQSNLAGISGQLGGVANIAGFSLNSSSSHRANLAIEVLKSRRFLANFMESNQLVIPVIAARGWDAEKMDWIYNDTLYSEVSGQDVDSRAYQDSLYEAVDKFKREILDVKEHRREGFLSIYMSHYSPSELKLWLDMIVKELNEEIRGRDVSESMERIDFLRNKLNETELSGAREALYRLLEMEYKTLMLSNVSQNYVFDIVDPPIVPRKPTQPSLRLLIVIGLGGGFILPISLIAVNSIRKRVW